MAQNSLITEQGFVAGLGLGSVPVSEEDLGEKKDKDDSINKKS